MWQAAIGRYYTQGVQGCHNLKGGIIAGCISPNFEIEIGSASESSFDPSLATAESVKELTFARFPF